MQPDDVEPPLRVDWIEPEHVGEGRAGRLGLTFLPGKRGASFRYPGRVYRRNLDQDVIDLVRQGVGVLVLLVEDHELARWGDLEIVGRAATHGLTVRRWPIADGSAPTTPEVMDGILDEIDQARASTDVAVACMGGVGRTGTVVACALVTTGLRPEEAIGQVRRVRHPTAVETPEQEAFVAAFARHRAKLNSLRDAAR